MSDGQRAYRSDEVEVQVIRTETPKPHFDVWYLASIPGGLKMVHVAGGFAVLFCMMMVHAAVALTYLCAVVVLCTLCVSIILLAMYLFNLVRLAPFNIKRLEAFFCLFGFVVYFVTAIFMTYSAVTWRRTSGMIPWTASAVFSYIVAAAYAADFAHRFRKMMTRNADTSAAEEPLNQTMSSTHEQSFDFVQPPSSDGYGHYGTPPPYTSVVSTTPPLTYGPKTLI